MLKFRGPAPPNTPSAPSRGCSHAASVPCSPSGPVLPHSAVEAACCESTSPRLAARGFLQRDEVRPELAGELKAGTRAGLQRLSMVQEQRLQQAQQEKGREGGAGSGGHGIIPPRVLAGSYTQLAQEEEGQELAGASGGRVQQQQHTGAAEAATPAAGIAGAEAGEEAGAQAGTQLEEGEYREGGGGDGGVFRLRGGGGVGGSEEDGGEQGALQAYQSPKMKPVAQAEQVRAAWGLIGSCK